MRSALHSAREQTGECVILSTCNRLELYALRHGGNDLETLSNLFGVSASELSPYTYHHTGAVAAQHLFTVSSGVDSLILGEVQILGQVQRAWQTAHEEGAVGPVLSQLFHKAISLAKRVHSETPISRNPASVSYAAVVLARQIFGQTLRSRRVLVIGTGEVGEGVARCLHENGLHATVVAHRQLERVHEVARRYEADVALWEELPQKLAEADILISSTSAPHTILQRHHIEEAMNARKSRPLYLIDLAVPRDIDPAAAGVLGVYLHNIDDLQQVVRTTLQEREAALPAIRSMIEAETTRFAEWLRVRSTGPAIHELRTEADRITKVELQWAMSKLPGLTERERQVVETMSARIAGKILHGPIQRLKAQSLEAVQPDYTLDGLSPQELVDLFYNENEASGAEEKRS